MKSPAAALGWGCMVIGLVIWVWGLSIETTVDVYNSEAVYNLGLIARQSQMVSAGLTLIIIGAIMIACGSIIWAIEQANSPKPSDPSITNAPADDYLG